MTNRADYDIRRWARDTNIRANATECGQSLPICGAESLPPHGALSSASPIDAMAERVDSATILGVNSRGYPRQVYGMVARSKGRSKIRSEVDSCVSK